MSTPGGNPLMPQAAGWYPDPAGTGGQRFHDGQGWTGQVIHGSGSTRRPLGQGFALLSDWLGRLLFLMAVPMLLMSVFLCLDWLNPGAAAQRDALIRQGQLSDATIVQLVAVVVFLVLWPICGVVWVVWQYRLAMQAPVRLRHSPGWHVGAWFVPFLSLVRPRADIGNLWEAYHRPGDVPRATPWTFWLWWLFWLSPQIYGLVTVMTFFSATFHQSTHPDTGAIDFIVFAGWTAAAFLARLVVRDLSWRALLYWSDVGA